VGAAGAATSAPPALDVAATECLADALGLSWELTGEHIVVSEAVLLALVRRDDVRAPLAAHGLRVGDLESSVQARQQPPIPLDDVPDLGDVTQSVDTARVLDACANRAREALRVLEDYTRFVLDDAYLSGELKALRHDLGAALDELGVAELLQARDTEGDVGTHLSGAGEYDRPSLRAVLRATCKRLQEALRSVEESGKVRSPRLGEALERTRYRAYTLERSLVLGTSARERLRDARLHVLLSGASCLASLEWTIAEAAAGGADVIQLREKSLGDRDLLARAR